MKKLYIAIFLALPLCNPTFAKTARNDYHVTSTGYPSQYDVVYDRISITVDPGTSRAISNGSVTTWFKTTASSVSSIGFDLDQAMNVSSVVYHGASLSGSNYSHSSNVLTITFPAAISPLGTLDSVTINYSGSPVSPTTSIPSGYNYSSSKKSIYTLGESYTGHDWWPCKDSLTDKIDSLDLIVTTPSAYRAAGNGTVTETTSGANRICTWKTRYPIATYMVNFAVASYTNYQYSITTGGKSLPVMNYLYSTDNTTTYHNYVNFIQNVLPVYVSVLNTDYPFLDEKYGVADCYGNWGALEVQSMTFCSSSTFDNSTLAHELSHQWFGDRLTTNDWHQIWLNEGFAQFFQSVVYPENLLSASSASSSRSSLKNSVSSSSTVYVSDISSVDKIFIGSGTQPYEKGAMLLSMLRAWMGDTKFYSALHDYLNAPGLEYNFTSVDSLKKYMQAEVQSKGFDLTNFFNDWIYQKGKVTYAVNYQYVTNGIYIQLTQSPTFSGAGYFDMPVPIEVKNGSGLDTLINIIDAGGNLYDNQTGYTYGTNVIYYKLSGTPSSITFDPNSAVLATSSSINSSSTLSGSIVLPVRDIQFSAGGVRDAVALNWTITSDEPVQTVIIEKSDNGTDFREIGREAAVSPDYGKYKGQFLDHEVQGSSAWYRLKVIQQDGKTWYSNIRRVTIRADDSRLEIRPNPVHGHLTLGVPASFYNSGGSLLLTIYNSAGQLMQQKRVSQIFNGTITIYCEDWPPGLYRVTVRNGLQEQIQNDFIKN